MSDYILNRIKNFAVKHIFSAKYHFFSVKNEKGKPYDVMIQVHCTCKYMGIQGVANGKICSHIAAVLKKISETGEIQFKEDELNGKNKHKKNKS